MPTAQEGVVPAFSPSQATDGREQRPFRRAGARRGLIRMAYGESKSGVGGLHGEQC